MAEVGEKCTVGLIVASILVLLFNYGFLAVGSVGSIELGIITLPEVIISHRLLPIAAFAFLGGLSICHFRHHRFRISGKYSEGYREHPVIVELVRATVAAAAESDKYGAPCSGIKAGLINRTHSLGRFQKPLGRLSAETYVTPTDQQHMKALRSGVLRAIAPPLWLPIYGAPLLALWAILTVAV